MSVSQSTKCDCNNKHASTATPSFSSFNNFGTSTASYGSGSGSFTSTPSFKFNVGSSL